MSDLPAGSPISPASPPADAAPGAGRPRPRARELAVLLLLATGSTLLLCANALRQFDFYDMSAFLDAGYRICRGQIPYVDFFYHSGPIHPYLHAFFFYCLGFGTTAILTHLCVVNGLALVATYLLARFRLSAGAAALVSAVGAVCFYGPISHPWYDQNSHLWLVWGILVVDRLLPLSGPRPAVAAGLACGVASALALATKTNIGVLAAAMFAFPLAVGPYRARALGAAVAAGLLMVAAVLLPLHSPGSCVLEAYVEAFRGLNVGNRLLQGGIGVTLLLSTPHALLPALGIGLAVAHAGGLAARYRVYAWYAAELVLATFLAWMTGLLEDDLWYRCQAVEFGLLAAAVGIPGWRAAPAAGRAAAVGVIALVLGGSLLLVAGRLPPPLALFLSLCLLLAWAAARATQALPPPLRARFALFFGVTFLSLTAAWTGSMLVQANLPLVGVELALLLGLASGIAPAAGPVAGGAGSAGRRRLLLHGVALAVGALGLWRTIALEAWLWRQPRDGRLVEDYALRVPALRGWRCERREGAPFDQAVEYIRRHVPEGDSLLVLPDMQVLYACLGRDSYRKVPICFAAGSGPVPGRQMEEFTRHFLHEPPRWILVHAQREHKLFNDQRLIEWLGLREILAQRYESAAEFATLSLLRLRPEEGAESGSGTEDGSGGGARPGR